MSGTGKRDSSLVAQLLAGQESPLLSVTAPSDRPPSTGSPDSQHSYDSVPIFSEITSKSSDVIQARHQGSSASSLVIR